MKTTPEKDNPQNNVELRVSEFETLRSELLENKRFVYERPLVIIAAGGVAAAQLKDNPHVLALPLFLIWILLVNLWFTVGRLRSNARIAAYINVFIEPENLLPWAGWENALRLHRIWMKQHPDEAERMRLVNEFVEQNAKPDAMTFYPMLLALHIVPVLFSVVTSLLILKDNTGTIPMMMCVLTVLSSLIFAVFAFGPWNHVEMRGLIETQRATWLAVFKEHSKLQAHATKLVK